MSAFGIETVPIPTALLSAHTGISGYYFFDLTRQMEEITDRLCDMAPRFDCIYSGFLGSEEQIDIVDGFLSKNPDALVVVDPVMADNGKIYETYTHEMCEKMKCLVKRANIITPNITEAAILLGEDYTVTSRTADEIRSWVKRLLSLGAKTVVITGHLESDKVTSFAANNSGEAFEFSVPSINIDISGAGDLFTSRFTAEYLNSGGDLRQSLETSCTFVFNSLSDTSKSGRNTNEGIIFEKRLSSNYEEIYQNQ